MDIYVSLHFTILQKSVKNKYYSDLRLHLLHDGPHQLFLILRNVQSVVIVESSVACDKEQRSTEDPEDDPSSPGYEEERDGADSDETVLLSQTDLMAGNGQFPLSILKSSNVAC